MSIKWECDVPLLSNPAIMGGFIKLWAIVAVIIVVLMGGIVGLRERIDAAIALATLLLEVAAGLFVVSLLILFVVFGNQMRMAFAVDDRGVIAQVIDARARAANRVSIVTGALAGKPGLAGAGLIAVGDEQRSALWSHIESANYDPGRHTIALKNQWRTLLYLFCTPENYQAVATSVSAAIGERPAGSKQPNPLGRVVGLTAIVLIACLPLFKMPYGFEPHLLAVMVTLAFSLAAIWLIPLMAWPALGGIAWIIISIVQQASRKGMDAFGRVSNGFDHLNGDKAGWLLVSGAGLLVLTAIAIAALRGQLPSLLERDLIATDDSTGRQSNRAGGKDNDA